MRGSHSLRSTLAAAPVVFAHVAITIPWDTYVSDLLKIYIFCFCNLSVREKDWRMASQAFEGMHNTLSHRVQT